MPISESRVATERADALGERSPIAESGPALRQLIDEGVKIVFAGTPFDA
jgi:hypothetical protein